MFTSQILTERQQQELNKAIVQYLETALDDDDTVTRVSQLLQVTPSDDVIPNYLEKKWSSVLRLQKKIIDLETEVGNLRSVLDTQSSPQNTVISKDKINWLPLAAAKSFRAQQLVQCCAIHPVFPIVAAGCVDGSVVVWNLGGDDTSLPEKLLRTHTRSINKVTWSPTAISIGDTPEYLLATCSLDLSIKIYGNNYRHIRTLTGHEHTISAVCFSTINPGILYSVSRDKAVKVWDLETGYCTRSFVGHSEWARDIDVCGGPSGDFVLTASNDQSARLSHAALGTGLALVLGHTHVVECVRFLPLVSNRVLDKYLRDNHALFPTIPTELVTDPVYERLGYKYCVTASRDNTVKVWLLPPPVLVPHRAPLPAKANNSQAWLVADLVGHQSWVKALSVHPNGRFVFSGGDDKTIRVWDLEGLNVAGTARCIRTLVGHEGFVNDVQFAGWGIEQKKEEQEDKNENGEMEKKIDDGYEEQLARIQTKMRCLFVSCGSDSMVKMWS